MAPASEEQSKRKGRKGLLLINTGNGKGKSTAGFGLLMRAWGRDMRVACIQFIKQENANYGEQSAARKMGIEITSSGRGFTWTSKNLNEDAERAQNGWKIATAKILSGDYDLVMLDEMTYPVTYGWLEVDSVLETLHSRPSGVHVIITGRNAHPKLVAAADTVTEMTPVKHHFDDQGIMAQKGIEL